MVFVTVREHRVRGEDGCSLSDLLAAAFLETTPLIVPAHDAERGTWGGTQPTMTYLPIFELLSHGDVYQLRGSQTRGSGLR